MHRSRLLLPTSAIIQRRGVVIGGRRNRIPNVGASTPTQPPPLPPPLMMPQSSSSSSSLSSSLGHVRTFFASSTDHTQLLANAEIHRLNSGGSNNNTNSTVTQYVLVANGMDLEMVKKVPQLHLARLYMMINHDNDSGEEKKIMYGAKVVNRTLGDPMAVCDKLVDAAKQDGATLAKSTLHGLTPYVIDCLGKGGEVSVEDQEYWKKEVEMKWDQWARDFIAAGKCAEANLYQAKGGRLTKILPNEDTSEFADTCGGAMAMYEFR